MSRIPGTYRRATLAELREIVLEELDDQWVTPSEITDTLELDHGPSWYRVALILERLANDGLAELKTPGSTVRRFRRSRRPPTPTTIVRAVDNSAQRIAGGGFRLETSTDTALLSAKYKFATKRGRGGARD